MSYTQDNFQEWIFFMSDKMDYFTENFAKENNLKLDYSIKSLDELEKWIINHFSTIDELEVNSKLLDLLTIYIGETFRKYIGCKWYIDLDNKKNVYYHMPILTIPHLKGEINIPPRSYATAIIDRKRGNFISTILKNIMEDMNIEIPIE